MRKKSKHGTGTLFRRVNNNNNKTGDTTMRITTEQTQAYANAVDEAQNTLLNEIRSTLDGLRQERRRRERANAAEPEARIDRLTKLRDAVSQTHHIGIGVRLALEPGWSTSPSA
mgnify:CR=1 FL=1